MTDFAAEDLIVRRDGGKAFRRSIVPALLLAWAGFRLASIVFGADGAREGEPWVSLLGLALFGAGALAFEIARAVSQSRLTLKPEGLVVGKRPPLDWGLVAEFADHKLGFSRSVTWTLRVRPKTRGWRRFMAPTHDGILMDDWEMSPRLLLATLESWRRRYSRP